MNKRQTKKAIKKVKNFSEMLHKAARSTGIFCPSCSYSFNGVLDDPCGKPDCPESIFELGFRAGYRKLSKK